MVSFSTKTKPSRQMDTLLRPGVDTLDRPDMDTLLRSALATLNRPGVGTFAGFCTYSEAFYIILGSS